VTGETPPEAGARNASGSGTEMERFVSGRSAAAADIHRDLAWHSRSAARYALLLARALGIFEERFLADLVRGALLHDIGKAAVPAEILRKAGPLSVPEVVILREHPVVGFRMIEGFGFLKGAAGVVLRHHERFDGRGYPSGLAGDEIPLAARIFAPADALEAMTADRPYRLGRSFEEALEEIGRCGGYQFDPGIVEIVLSLPVETWRRARFEPPGPLPLPTIH
jgi:putative nucleotidyltransferase with HDIG domain